MVEFTLHFGPLVLFLLPREFVSAAGETIQVKDEDAPLLRDIDVGLSSLMAAAKKCRSTDANVYTCMCKEATSLQQLAAAPRAALERKPE